MADDGILVGSNYRHVLDTTIFPDRLPRRLPVRLPLPDVSENIQIPSRLIPFVKGDFPLVFNQDYKLVPKEKRKGDGKPSIIFGKYYGIAGYESGRVEDCIVYFTNVVNIFYDTKTTSTTRIDPPTVPIPYRFIEYTIYRLSFDPRTNIKKAHTHANLIADKKLNGRVPNIANTIAKFAYPQSHRSADGNHPSIMRLGGKRHRQTRRTRRTRNNRY